MSADSRALSPTFRLDTDVLILDYLVFTATSSLLRIARKHVGSDASTTDYGRDKPADAYTVPEDLLTQLQLVESFVTIFKSAHHSSSSLAPHPHSKSHHHHHNNGHNTSDTATYPDGIPPNLPFRLQLLRFTTLFTLRKYPNPTTPPASALLTLRRGNAHRAHRWRLRTKSGRDDATPPVHQPEPESGPETITLLDLIPSFLDLTASRAHLAAEAEVDSEPASRSPSPSPSRCKSPTSDDNAMDIDHAAPSTRKPQSDWAPSPRWLDLVAEMMRQAVLERIQATGEYYGETAHTSARISAANDEAFAWGPLDGSRAEEHQGEGTDEEHHDELFILASERDIDTAQASPNSGHPPGSHWRSICLGHRVELSILARKSATVATPANGAQQSRSTAYWDQVQKSLAEFEAHMLSFLGALHDGVGGDVPTLVKLEMEGSG